MVETFMKNIMEVLPPSLYLHYNTLW